MYHNLAGILRLELARADSFTLRQVLSILNPCHFITRLGSALMIQLKGFNALCVSVAEWMDGAERETQRWRRERLR